MSDIQICPFVTNKSLLRLVFNAEFIEFRHSDIKFLIYEFFLI